MCVVGLSSLLATGSRKRHALTKDRDRDVTSILLWLRGTRSNGLPSTCVLQRPDGETAHQQWLGFSWVVARRKHDKLLRNRVPGDFFESIISRWKARSFANATLPMLRVRPCGYGEGELRAKQFEDLWERTWYLLSPSPVDVI
ncbi:hypothetical protein CPSG_01241 [Coccidioides posadasii str. Silveira]|uniref:Uncharacterized protein n=1 Tax=Coccidioides posadasii (strain RMSCC 757 / Silveira) TaxID=443226 RepID=E9CRW7_COCPS|nr:hypothetical protein CPSG_01241 [Coccidioides posadasii str. Silveira]